MKNSFSEINSVVIVGASEQTGKIGNDLLKNLKNFGGEKLGVNPKGGKFEGINFYESIDKLPIIPDIAVIVIPAKFVLTSLEEIVQKGIKRVIIISAGFKEIGNIEAENEIKKIAKENDIQILGPNCLGYIDTSRNLNLSFGSKEIQKGNIAMISQSGAMAVAFTDWARSFDLGFSKIISMGNKADISENELLLELENDDETKVIVMYLESIEKARDFYEIAKKITPKKPIILIKSGMSDRGSMAASSHTGALAGSAIVFKTAFRQSGIIYTSKLEDFFLWGKTFSKIDNFENIPEELAIITNAGGPGVMITDHCEFLGIKLAEFSEGEKKILMQGLPETASVKNPIDIIGDATSKRYIQILENLNSLEKKRAILIMLTPQTTTDVENIAQAIVDFKKQNLGVFIMTSFMGGESLKKSNKILSTKQIFNYTYPQKAVLAYSKVLIYKKLLKTNFSGLKVNTDFVRKDILEKLSTKLKVESKLVSNDLTGEILETFGINYLSEKLIKSEKETEKIFEKMGNNKLIAKISSPDIAHKTDVGGIYFDINSNDEAKKAYLTILKNVSEKEANAKISGVTFARQLDNSTSNREIFVGLKRDESFGDILIVGMGGIFVNIYEDVSRRLAPVCKDEIKIMLKQLKGYKILAGYRGEESINFENLIENIFKLQFVFRSFPQIKEIDINPIFANNKEAIIVDAKFYL